MSSIITDRDMRVQVEHVLGDVADHFDVSGIVRDLLDLFGRVDVGRIPPGPFWATVRAWEHQDSR